MSILDFRSISLNLMGSFTHSEYTIKCTLNCTECIFDLIHWHSDFSWIWEIQLYATITSTKSFDSVLEVSGCILKGCSQAFLEIHNVTNLIMVLNVEIFDPQNERAAFDTSTFALAAPHQFDHQLGKNEQNTSVPMTRDVFVSETTPEPDPSIENHTVPGNKQSEVDILPQNQQIEWNGLPTYALITKAYMDGWHELITSQLLSFLVFWPRNFGVLVLVLDDEDEDEHVAGAILQQFSNQIKIVYERLPFNPKSIFLANSGEFRIGYDRQRWGRMWCDKYSEADVLGIMDADSNFITPVTPGSLYAGDKVRIGAVYHHKGYYRETVEMALGLPHSNLDFMVRFPLAFKRQHFAECRRHIVATMRAPDFNAAWRRLMETGDNVSPETLMGNYVWHFRREEYAWHVQPLYLVPEAPPPAWLEWAGAPMPHITHHKEAGDLSDVVHALKPGYCHGRNAAATARSVEGGAAAEGPWFCRQYRGTPHEGLGHFAMPGADFSELFTTPSVGIDALTSAHYRGVARAWHPRPADSETVVSPRDE